MVVVVVVVAGSLTSVVQELRNAAKAGIIQTRVNFFISKVVTLRSDSLQVPVSDVLKPNSIGSWKSAVGLLPAGRLKATLR